MVLGVVGNGSGGDGGIKGGSKEKGGHNNLESAVLMRPPPPSALSIQEGGNHYKDNPIQPVEYMMANNIGFMEGNVIKYVTRWKDKGGVEDLKKARHYLDMLIEAQ